MMENGTPRQFDLMGIPSAISGESHALFFGIFPDDEVRRAIDRAAMSLEAGHRPSGRKIQPRRYHMTLHFVGQYSIKPDDVIERLKRVGDRW
jgi:2'-5' RNA ligase